MKCCSRAFADHCCWRTTEAEESVSSPLQNATHQTPRATAWQNGVLTGVSSSHRYNTRSNKVRVIKTPGGHLRYLHIKKKGSPPKCGDCGICLPGVSQSLPFEFLAGFLAAAGRVGLLVGYAEKGGRRMGVWVLPDCQRPTPRKGVEERGENGVSFPSTNTDHPTHRSPLSALASTRKSPSPKRPSNAPMVVPAARTVSKTVSCARS